MIPLITEPGWYADVDSATYHSLDLTPELAIGSTGARSIIKSPLRFWAESPLNSAYQPKVSEAFDIGSALHLVVLEPSTFEDRISVLPHENFRTNAAKADRDAARANGLIPLLASQMDDVLAMRDAVHDDPLIQMALAGNALFEQTFIWRDPISDRWCKTRPDVFIDEPTIDYLVDLKTAESADALDFKTAITRHGYHCQAAWYLDGVSEILKDEIAEGRRVPLTRYLYVVVEKTPPYLTNVIELEPEAIEVGRRQNQAALGIFNACMASGQWPRWIIDGGFQPRVQRVGINPWAMTEHYDLEQAGVWERLAALRSVR